MPVTQTPAPQLHLMIMEVFHFFCFQSEKLYGGHRHDAKLCHTPTPALWHQGHIGWLLFWFFVCSPCDNFWMPPLQHSDWPWPVHKVFFISHFGSKEDNVQHHKTKNNVMAQNAMMPPTMCNGAFNDEKCHLQWCTRLWHKAQCPGTMHNTQYHHA